MAVPTELLRLQDNVTRFGGVDAQGLLQRVNGLGKPLEAEQQIAPFEPRPAIPAVCIEHPLVALEGLLLAAEQGEQFGPIEPDGDFFRPIPKEAVIARECGFVVAFPEEGERLLLQARDVLLLIDLTRNEFVSNGSGQRVPDSLALR